MDVSPIRERFTEIASQVTTVEYPEVPAIKRVRRLNVFQV
jgi:hypothetical protein